MRSLQILACLTVMPFIIIPLATIATINSNYMEEEEEPC